MTNYRRNFISGGSYFFTVNLADRRLRLLTEQIALLREVVPGFGTTGLSGGAGCSVMVDGADDEENETEVRCRREGEDSA